MIDSLSLAGHSGKAFLLEQNGEVAPGLRIAHFLGISLPAHPTDPRLFIPAGNQMSVQIDGDLYGTMPICSFTYTGLSPVCHSVGFEFFDHMSFYHTQPRQFSWSDMSVGSEWWGTYRNVWSSDVGRSGSVFNWLTRMMSLSSSKMAKESRGDEGQCWEFESVDFKAWDDDIREPPGGPHILNHPALKYIR